jgi:hypothetical protein
MQIWWAHLIINRIMKYFTVVFDMYFLCQKCEGWNAIYVSNFTNDF